jgi:hypothetical protein
MVWTRWSQALSTPRPDSIRGRRREMGLIMFGALGGGWSPELGGPDRTATWENVYDDGYRTDLLPYRSDLLRLDECGPSATPIASVL